MPKKCFPETWSCESSMRMNSILKSKLREFAHDIHKHIDSGNDDESVKALIREQMNIIFRYDKFLNLFHHLTFECGFNLF
jgi:bleomycin hydrolase